MVDTKKGPYYALFDSSDDAITAILETGLGTADAFKGETIEELATASKASNLAATFAAYATIAQSGKDTEFNKAEDRIKAYGDGPYYLVRIVPSYVATMGGVRTDANCQAISADGTPIEGLYVVGEATHRFMYNRSFISAASNGSGITMGRLTGELIASKL
jgi:predicted oxidoreductase